MQLKGGKRESSLTVWHTKKKLKVLVDKHEIKIILCTTQCHKTGSEHYYTSCGSLSELSQISNGAAYKCKATHPLDKDRHLSYDLLSWQASQLPSPVTTPKSLTTLLITNWHKTKGDINSHVCSEEFKRERDVLTD